MASYYGKRPLWQWIALYAIVGGIIYFLVYYFVLAPKGGYSKSGGYNTSTQSAKPASNSGSTTGY